MLYLSVSFSVSVFCLSAILFLCLCVSPCPVCLPAFPLSVSLFPPLSLPPSLSLSFSLSVSLSSVKHQHICAWGLDKLRFRLSLHVSVRRSPGSQRTEHTLIQPPTTSRRFFEKLKSHRPSTRTRSSFSEVWKWRPSSCSFRTLPWFIVTVRQPWFVLDFVFVSV